MNGVIQYSKNKVKSSDWLLGVKNPIDVVVCNVQTLSARPSGIWTRGEPS
jgi:hypothetical protein